MRVKLAVLVFCAAWICMGAPCDDQPHVQDGIGMRCEVIGAQMVVHIETSSALTHSVSVTVEFHTVVGKARQSFLLFALPPWPAKIADILRLADGAVVDNVGVEELLVFNSGGFIQ